MSSSRTARRSRPQATASPRSCSPSATPGRASCSCSATSPTSSRQDPNWADDYTEQQGQVRRRAGPRRASSNQAGGLRRQGLLNEDFASALTNDRRSRCSPTGKGAQYPMLTGVDRDHPAELPRQRRRHRRLRAAGAERCRHRAHRLAAERGLHRRRPPRAPSSTPRRSSSRSLNSPAAATIQTTGRCRAVRSSRAPCTLPDDASRPADRRHAAVLRRRQTGSGARVPLPDQGTEPREHHGRGRLRHHAPPRTAPRSTTRTSSSRLSSSASRAGDPRRIPELEHQVDAGSRARGAAPLHINGA